MVPHQSARSPRKVYKRINEPLQRDLADTELLSLPGDHIDIYFPPTVYVSGSIAARRTQHAIGRLSKTSGTFVWMSAGFERGKKQMGRLNWVGVQSDFGLWCHLLGRRRFQTEPEELRGRLQVGTQGCSKANVAVVTILAISAENQCIVNMS